jgi:hypothetical protein
MDNKSNSVPMRLGAILLSDTEKILKEIAIQNNIQYISAIDALCTADGCVARIGDNDEDFIQVDSAHMSKVGSEYLLGRIKDKIF